jgi:hypothetical protein
MSVATHGSGAVNEPRGLFVPAPSGVVGATAGWTVRAAADTALATCAAGSTAATFVLPLAGLKVGQAITGYGLAGQIESAGGAVTVDCSLWKHSHYDDASDIQTQMDDDSEMTQISVIADTNIDKTNSFVTGLSQTVDSEESFFLLLTVTTAASTDVAFQGAYVVVIDA